MPPTPGWGLSCPNAGDAKVHPCAFYSHRLSPAERNYDIRNKELLAVKLAMEEWRQWLEGARLPFLVWTDHKNLEYLHSAKRLDSRQAWWALFFSRFDFHLAYRPGLRNVKPDALSRVFDPEDRIEVPETILRPEVFVNATGVDIEREVREAACTWSAPRPRLGLPPPVPSGPPAATPHTSPPLVTHRTGFCYWAPHLQSLHHHPHHVDRFSKAVHFVPLNKLPSASEAAHLLVQHVICLHGIPTNIVSDHGPQFISRFWRAFCTLLGTTVSLTSGFHPQSNGQTERANQCLETVLRCLCANNPASWSTQLPWAEYAINGHTSAASKLSPFECCLGYRPPLFPSQEEEVRVSSAVAFIRRCKQTWRATRTNLVRAVQQMKEQADRRRRPVPPTGLASVCGSRQRTSPSEEAHVSLHPGTWGPSSSPTSLAPQPSD